MNNNRKVNLQVKWLMKIRIFYGSEVWIVVRHEGNCLVSQKLVEWCQTVVPSHRIFSWHQTAIMDSFSCILLHHQMDFGSKAHYLNIFMLQRSAPIYNIDVETCGRKS